MSDLVTEQLEWLRRVLNFSWPGGGDVEPEPVVKEPPDPREAKLSNELMLVHQAAVTHNLLDGERDDLLRTGTEQIEAKQYDEAANTIATLKQALQTERDRKLKQKKDKEDYERERKGMEEDEQAVALIGDLPADLKSLKGTVEASRAKTEDFVSKGEFDKALASLTQFKADITAALERNTALATAKGDYERERETMKEDELAVSQAGDLPADLKTLKGTVEASRAKTEDFVSKGEFDKALASLTQFKADITAALERNTALATAKGDYERERETMKENELAVSQIGDLPADLKTLKATVDASRTKTEDFVTKGEFDQALASLTQFKADITAALQRRDAVATEKSDYERERQTMATDEQAVASIGDVPLDLKALKEAVGVSKGKTEDFVSKGEYDKALASLTQFKADIKAALDRNTALATAKTDYERDRKAMGLNEKAAMRIADTPGALKDLKDAFLASRGKTDDFVSKGEFDKARDSLAQLRLDLDAAVKKRRTETEQAIKAKVDDVELSLDEVDTNSKPVWQNVGSPKWKAVVDKVCALTVDDEFTDSYDAKNTAVADKLAKDPIVQAAYDNWATWTADPPNVVEIEKLMAQVVKLQSEVIGIDPPTPTETFTNTAKPRLCGSYGGGKIKLNTANAGFKDFRELLDTLTHENTHAYQTQLVKGLEPPPQPPPIQPGHPEYSAAIIFLANDNKGYVTSDESKKYPGKNAYDNQPTEVHAWRAGRLAGQEAFAAIKKAKGG